MTSPRIPTLLLLLCVLSPLLPSAHAAGRRFRNIATDKSRGLKYSRTPSRTRPAWFRLLKSSLTEPLQAQLTPSFPWDVHGQPGVAVGDFDGDGLDDIYVTNGPGSHNSLFINQLKRTGKLSFRDVANSVGVGARTTDATGVCYGDLNGDGKNDIVVVSEFDRNIIFLSTNTTVFRRLDWVRATGDRTKKPSSGCAIGDVNNDGRLDILVSNGVPRKTAEGCLVVAFAMSSPNQLFLNMGPRGAVPLKFKDVSLTSGINNFATPDIPRGKYTMSWAAALVDINLDGHLDVVLADDQCGLATKQTDPANGANRGWIHVQYGDGTGNFRPTVLSPKNPAANNRVAGDDSWMALGFGDFNCDGKVDIFGSNAGDYHAAMFNLFMGRTPSGLIGQYSSRWWLGTGDNKFEDASIEETGATVFGWGNAVCDYDNDGDQDIFMVGGLDFPAFGGSDNPNVIYKNEGCTGKFSYDTTSWGGSGRYRNYRGLAIGDFNMDGYPDIVGASGFVAKARSLTRIINYSSEFDQTAYFTQILQRNEEAKWVWTGNSLLKGDLMVDINRATDRSKCWVSVQAMGTRGILEGGKVNRGGLGSTLFVTGKGMKTVTTPIASGESFGSQHSPRRNFGLGAACKGDVEILWAGGGRMRLYGVQNRERLTIPEVPCDFAGTWETEEAYEECVDSSVRALVGAGVLKRRMAKRIAESGLRARKEFLARR
ncbi:unnamed protein product [Chondrus crispus]|uniref:ASPIC/UnbV domain-containing protein n=1 Tax=Chondrus crispus TaxID=2769 RepID=R7QJ19_CHOCR|nr:unnamed protein product [Chondrus crispus]CDF37415.1 unnamed protein product [Chondrus crispus]|eukprot:XP_005717234.1 unnamed protein product [Chondrus crispus]